MQRVKVEVVDISKVFIQPIFMIFKFLQIWNLENDILIFQYFATVSKFPLLFQSTKIEPWAGFDDPRIPGLTQAST